MWDSLKNGYKTYLRLERNLSDNSINAYLRDINHLTTFLEDYAPSISAQQVDKKHLKEFLKYLYELNIAANSQARIISGIKSFFRYLLLEDVIAADPTELINTPKTGRKLPDTLSYDEITKLIQAIDLSTSEGERNKAILETLYGCGLRVSELINMKISNLFFDEGFIRIVGKGDKERLIPIGPHAQKQIQIYVEQIRTHLSVAEGHEDFVFLNRRGKQLTRVMIFTMIKQLTEKVGLKKSVSPHTFRHSFATHLVEGGANLRAVQEMLGHQSITTTEIYTHLDRHFLSETIQEFHPMSKKKANDNAD